MRADDEEKKKPHSLQASFEVDGMSICVGGRAPVNFVSLDCFARTAARAGEGEEVLVTGEDEMASAGTSTPNFRMSRSLLAWARSSSADGLSEPLNSLAIGGAAGGGWAPKNFASFDEDAPATASAAPPFPGFGAVVDVEEVVLEGGVGAGVSEMASVQSRQIAGPKRASVTISLPA
jgi:hypothetical protein